MMLRVLLVENDAAIASGIESVLLDAGYQVETVLDIASTLARLKSVRTDLVLLVDACLEKPFDGLALAGMARALAPSLPVIYMSGYLHAEFPPTQLVNNHLYLHKPFSIDDLLCTLAKAVEGTYLKLLRAEA